MSLNVVLPKEGMCRETEIEKAYKVIKVASLTCFKSSEAVR